MHAYGLLLFITIGFLRDSMQSDESIKIGQINNNHAYGNCRVLETDSCADHTAQEFKTLKINLCEYKDLFIV